MKEIKRIFGLHFDFHANNDSAIGVTTAPKAIEKYILETKPDFIQCDCKGHPGISSYPTRVGTPADKFERDNLKIWTEVSKKHKVPLFVHYSGVKDAQYVKDHPDQAEVAEEGAAYEKDSVSVFGDYAENLLIPQLKELITEYGISGVWFDGEVWAVHRDYSPMAKALMWDGITKEEHNALMRKGFFDYVKKYTDALHKFNPDFKVISNWIYSTYAPEKPKIEVDYLSGDFQPSDSAHFVRLESRVLGVQGKKWDLMAWSFTAPNRMDKSAEQLCQEAALVLAQGGGFQLYIPQNRDGSPKEYIGNTLKEIADFVHKREYLYGKKPLAQIGVLYSADSFYKRNNVFCHEGAADKLVGAVNLLADSGYTVNIVLEWQMDSIDKYEVMVVPEWEFISKENKEQLLNFAQNGGNLIVLGTECCRQFMELLGEESELLSLKRALILDDNGCFATVKPKNDNICEFLKLKEGKGGIYSAFSTDSKVGYSYSVKKYGNGNIIYIPFKLGELYFDVRSFYYQNFIIEVLNCFTEKLVATDKFIDITLQETEDGMYLNLINMNQSRHSLQYEVFERIPERFDVKVTVNRSLKEVLALTGEKINWEVKDGRTDIYIKKLHIHTCLKIK